MLYALFFLTMLFVYPSILLTFFCVIKPLQTKFKISVTILVLISMAVGFCLPVVLGSLFSVNSESLPGYGMYGSFTGLATSSIFGLIAGYKFS